MENATIHQPRRNTSALSVPLEIQRQILKRVFNSFSAQVARHEEERARLNELPAYESRARDVELRVAAMDDRDSFDALRALFARFNDRCARECRSDLAFPLERERLRSQSLTGPAPTRALTKKKLKKLLRRRAKKGLNEPADGLKPWEVAKRQADAVAVSAGLQ